jgi:hypothetical protein
LAKFFPERVTQYSVWALWTLLVLSSVLWLLVGSVAYWVRNGWLPADSAGWAQAIGAFVAIVVAIALPYFQSRQQQIQREVSEKRNRLEGINATYALMTHMQGLYDRLGKSAKPTYTLHGAYFFKDEGDSLVHELAQAAAMLREIPVVAISNQMVYFIIGLREVANYAEFVATVMEKSSMDAMQATLVRNKIIANIDLIKVWITELDDLEE